MVPIAKLGRIEPVSRRQAEANAAASEVTPFTNNVVKIEWGENNHGSGCYLGGRLVLAAAHQFKGLQGQPITVELRSGERLPGRLIASEGHIDSAVVELESDPRTRLPTVRLADSVSVGDRCYSFGWGYTDTLKISAGRVLEVAGGMVRTTSDIRSGDSGGPLFLADGSLCGPMVGAPDWRGTGPVNSTTSLAVSCGPLRQFLHRIDAWKRQVGLGCLAPPLPGPRRPPPLIQPEPITSPPGPIDYDVLAARVVELMAADPRFRGTTGEPGPPGLRGSQGPPGAAGSLGDLQELADKIGPLLDKMNFQLLDADFNVVQEYQAGPGGTVPFQLVPVGAP